MNEELVFDKIWKYIVEPTITKYTQQYQKNIRKKTRSKRIAKRWFCEEAQIFVYSYMVNDTKNIDRHKLAACMMKAILIAKPIKITFATKFLKVINKIEFPDDNIYWINQKIALNVALIILEGYINSDKSKIIKHSMRIPEPFPEGTKDYLKDVGLELYYMKPKNINTMTYANIFFLWEKYSCRVLQCENLEHSLFDYIQMTNNQLKVQQINQKISDIKMQSEKPKDTLN